MTVARLFKIENSVHPGEASDGYQSPFHAAPELAPYFKTLSMHPH